MTYNGVATHGKDRHGRQCLTHLDLLPPKGAVIVPALALVEAAP
jgi:hypothetical protein